MLLSWGVQAILADILPEKRNEGVRGGGETFFNSLIEINHRQENMWGGEKPASITRQQWHKPGGPQVVATSLSNPQSSCFSKRRHFEVQFARLLRTKCQSVCVAGEHWRGRNGREEEQTVYVVVGLLKTLPGDGATSRAPIRLQTQNLEVKKKKEKGSGFAV